jgi:mRNA interferase RelE/StbE
MKHAGRKYQVNLKKSVIKDLEKLPDIVLKRVQKTILALSDNPRPEGCKKLKGRDDYRVRVGDYRILYFIDDEIVTIEVVRLQHRKEVYD